MTYLSRDDPLVRIFDKLAINILDANKETSKHISILARNLPNEQRLLVVIEFKSILINNSKITDNGDAYQSTYQIRNKQDYKNVNESLLQLYPNIHPLIKYPRASLLIIYKYTHYCMEYKYIGMVSKVMDLRPWA